MCTYLRLKKLYGSFRRWGLASTVVSPVRGFSIAVFFPDAGGFFPDAVVGRTEEDDGLDDGLGGVDGVGSGMSPKIGKPLSSTLKRGSVMTSLSG